MLEDIERIEVIRGPGAHAVGRQRRQRRHQHHHQDRQGHAGRVGLGRRRHGGARASARPAGRHRSAKSSTTASTPRASTDDDSPIASTAMARTAGTQVPHGFRLDCQPTDAATLLTLSATCYRQDYGSTAVRSTRARSALLGPTTSGTTTAATSSDAGITALRTFQPRRSRPTTTGSTSTNSASEDDHDSPTSTSSTSSQLVARNHVVWGLGYRYTHSGDRRNRHFRPDDRSNSLLSAFVQDEIALIRDDFGSPSARRSSTTTPPASSSSRAPYPLVADAKHSMWGAISRAVRIPSIGDQTRKCTIAVIPPRTPGPAAAPDRDRLLRRSGHRLRGPPGLRARLSRSAAGEGLVRRHSLLQHLRRPSSDRHGDSLLRRADRRMSSFRRDWRPTKQPRRTASSWPPTGRYPPGGG